MKPKLYEYTKRDGDIETIITNISKFDCSSFFGNHLGKSQSDQKILVNTFQTEIFNHLSKNIKNISWNLEYRPDPNKKDSIDIFGSNEYICIVIEIDKHRADQVAKKFVSRNALLIDKNLFYVSLCYPGTEKMNSIECIKYFGYCKKLSNHMSNEYAGFIIE